MTELRYCERIYNDKTYYDLYIVVDNKYYYKVDLCFKKDFKFVNNLIGKQIKEIKIIGGKIVNGI